MVDHLIEENEQRSDLTSLALHNSNQKPLTPRIQSNWNLTLQNCRGYFHLKIAQSFSLLDQSERAEVLSPNRRLLNLKINELALLFLQLQNMISKPIWKRIRKLQLRIMLRSSKLHFWVRMWLNFDHIMRHFLLIIYSNCVNFVHRLVTEKFIVQVSIVTNGRAFIFKHLSH